MVKLAPVVVLGLCLSLAGVCAAQMNARVDRPVVGMDETFDLIIDVPGQKVSGEPDLEPLRADFDIIGQSRSTRVNIVNGKTDAETSFHITLAPRRAGRLRIPPLTLAGWQSKALTVEVRPAGQPDGSTGKDVFLETEASPLNPYVQAQITYTVRLFHAIDIREGSLSEPDLGGTVTERIGDDITYEVRRNGRSYRVIERRYALFPQASGPLRIPRPVFTGQVPDTGSGTGNGLFGRRGGFGGDPFSTFFRPTRPIRVSGPAIDLDVRPAPAQAAGGPWLPAASLVVKEAWNTDPLEFRVGEPTTRTITILARGLTGAQLPDLVTQTNPAIRVYPDQPVTKTFTEGVHVIGKREVKLALVPMQAGRYTLPEISLRWWSTRLDKPQQATIPARTISVLPATSSATDTTPASPATEATPRAAPADSHPVEPLPGSAAAWPALAAALLAGWAITVGLWIRERSARRKRAAQAAARAPDISKARREAINACRRDDPALARDAVLALGAALWPDDPPGTLMALAARVQSSEVREAIGELDRLLYSGEEARAWRGDALMKSLDTLAGERSKREAPNRSPLPALYPPS